VIDAGRDQSGGRSAPKRVACSKVWTMRRALPRFPGSPTVRLHVGAVSVWEMRLKHDARYRSGARKGPFDPNAVLTVLENQELVFVPMTMRHAARALDVPLGHRDPFDELLLEQAQEEASSCSRRITIKGRA